VITIIAAAGQNNELGKDNDLVWHLPNDFKRFKKLTTGHFIIMGRKTYESFPKPLPNRTHIIISRNTSYIPKVPENRKADVFLVHSMEAALEKAKSDLQPFIIGGGEIYKLAMEVSAKIELTRVHNTFDADTFFPEIPKGKWQLKNEIHHQEDKQHSYSFSYETWVKKR